MIDLRRLGTTVALSCLIATTQLTLATVSAAGRGGAQAARTGAGGRNTPSGANVRPHGRGQSRATAQPAPATPATAPSAGRDARARSLPRQTAVLSIPATPQTNPNPGDPPAANAAPARSAVSHSAESSSIHPLQPSPLPQTSPSSSRGALRLDTQPASAQLYVDGFYVGTVEEANRSEAGLSLPTGWHRLEIRAPGYLTPAINVTIEPNRTLSYHGDLTPLRR